MRPSLAEALRRASQLVPAASFLALLAMVALWGVDLPHWDQIGFAPLVVDLFEDELALSDLAERHNEHSLFFPRLVMLGLAAVTRWDVRVELYTIALLAGVVFLAVPLALRRMPNGELSARARRALLIATALLVFSPNQWENWVWGWQIQVLLSVAAVVWSLVLLWSWPGRLLAVLAAALCGVVATFSYANGVIVWPVGIGLLIARRPRLTRCLVAYSVVALAAIAVLLSTGDSVPGVAFPQDAARWLGFSYYFLRYLGAVVWGAVDGRLAASAGAAALLAWVLLGLFSLRGGDATRKASELWLALGAYAVLSGLLTALGRYETHPLSALTPRYWTVSNFLWISILGLVSLRPPPGSRRLQAAVCGLILLLVPGWVYGGVRGASLAHGQHRPRVEIRQTLLEDRFTEAAASHMHPNRQILRRNLMELCRSRLGIFREVEPSFPCELADYGSRTRRQSD